jgi:mannose-1-phosphate guanylyltransferase
MHEKVENAPGNLANAAVFLFSPEVFDIVRQLKGTAVVDISRDMIPLLLGRLVAFQTFGYHRDIGTVESLTIARRDVEKIQRERAE